MIPMCFVTVGHIEDEWLVQLPKSCSHLTTTQLARLDGRTMDSAADKEKGGAEGYDKDTLIVHGCCGKL